MKRFVRFKNHRSHGDGEIVRIASRRWTHGRNIMLIALSSSMLIGCSLQNLTAAFSFQRCDLQPSDYCSDLNESKATGDDCKTWQCNPQSGYCEILTVDGDGDGIPSATCAAEGEAIDCNDDNENIYPGAPELCDEIDNDCDDTTDENLWGFYDVKTHDLPHEATSIDYAANPSPDSSTMIAMYNFTDTENARSAIGLAWYPSYDATPTIDQLHFLRSAAEIFPLEIDPDLFHFGPVSPAFLGSGYGFTATRTDDAAFSEDPMLISTFIWEENGEPRRKESNGNLESRIEGATGTEQGLSFDGQICTHFSGPSTLNRLGDEVITVFRHTEEPASQTGGCGTTSELVDKVGVSRIQSSTDENAPTLSQRSINLAEKIPTYFALKQTQTSSAKPAVLGIEDYGWLVGYPAQNSEGVIAVFRLSTDFATGSAPVFSIDAPDADEVQLTAGPISGNTAQVLLSYRQGNKARVQLKFLEVDLSANTIGSENVTLMHSLQAPESEEEQRRPFALYNSASERWIVAYDFAGAALFGLLRISADYSVEDISSQSEIEEASFRDGIVLKNQGESIVWLSKSGGQMLSGQVACQGESLSE